VSAVAIRTAVAAGGRLVNGRGGDVPVPWWSFGKTVIAATALVLVQDGILRLDLPVDPRGFTLRQLLQHRAGLANYGGLPAYHEAVARQEEPWPFPVLLERTGADRLVFSPGEGWAYSNIGYALVRRIIETAVGQGLGEAAAHLVLRPLGIERARLATRPEDLCGVDLGAESAYHPGWVYHGLFVGPIEQAALLLDRLMSGTLLTEPTLAEMRRRHVLEGPIPDRPWVEPGYGLGAMTGRTSRGTQAIGHTGGGPGSVCAVYRTLETGRTAATFAPGDDAAAVEDETFRLGLEI
jgi:CubicO group peptidase (beta-lactamase class C family)